MKITIVIDSDNVIKIVRRISLSLAAFAVLLFLVLSVVLFHYSQDNNWQYQIQYQQLSSPGQVVASSMVKTGEVEDSILNNKNAFRNTKSKSKKNAFFDSVSNNHKGDKN